MKHCIIFIVSLVLSFGSSGFAQNAEMEDSLNKLIDELHELGAKQDPEEIDHIPPLTEEEFNDLVEYSKSLSDTINSAECDSKEFDNEKSEKLSFSEFIKYNPTIAEGTSLVKYLGWAILIVSAALGWFLIKRKRLFIGKMILSSLLPLFIIYSYAVTTDLSYYPYAWALAMLIIYGIMLSSIGCFYLYGCGTIIFIYNRSENRYRIIWLIISILLCLVFPLLFIIPIIYFISIGNLKTEDCKDTILYKLIPYISGILLGLIISIPFCAFTGYVGRMIREIIYYLQYLW